MVQHAAARKLPQHRAAGQARGLQEQEGPEGSQHAVGGAKCLQGPDVLPHCFLHLSQILHNLGSNSDSCAGVGAFGCYSLCASSVSQGQMCCFTASSTCARSYRTCHFKLVCREWSHVCTYFWQTACCGGHPAFPGARCAASLLPSPLLGPVSSQGCGVLGLLPGHVIRAAVSSKV